MAKHATMALDLNNGGYTFNHGPIVGLKHGGYTCGRAPPMSFGWRPETGPKEPPLAVKRKEIVQDVLFTP